MRIMDLNEHQQSELIARALAARGRAYAPYSRYTVGAALLTSSGRIFDGVNVENAVYPLTMCAERTAIFKAISEGDLEILAIAVASRNGGSPCGSCRQVLAEFGPQAQVIMVNEQGQITGQAPLTELLPLAFGPDDLNPD
jgi:cytidine deaminase